MTAPQDVPALLREAYAHAETADTFGRHSMATTLRALAALVEAQQWRPIETAPKDGTRVLLYDSLDGSHYAAEWDGYGPGDEEGSWAVYCGQYKDCDVEPTHWMPLPPAPGGSHE